MVPYKVMIVMSFNLAGFFYSIMHLLISFAPIKNARMSPLAGAYIKPSSIVSVIVSHCLNKDLGIALEGFMTWTCL